MVFLNFFPLNAISTTFPLSAMALPYDMFNDDEDKRERDGTRTSLYLKLSTIQFNCSIEKKYITFFAALC